MAKKPNPKKNKTTPQEVFKNECVELVSKEYYVYPSLIIPNEEDLAELERLRKAYGVTVPHFKLFVFMQTMSRMVGHKTGSSVTALDHIINFVDKEKSTVPKNNRILGSVLGVIAPSVVLLSKLYRRWLKENSSMDALPPPGVFRAFPKLGSSIDIDKITSFTLSNSGVHNHIQFMKHVGVFVEKVFPQHIYGYGQAPLYYPMFVKRDRPQLKSMGDMISEFLSGKADVSLFDTINAAKQESLVFKYEFKPTGERFVQTPESEENVLFSKTIPSANKAKREGDKPRDKEPLTPYSVVESLYETFIRTTTKPPPNALDRKSIETIANAELSRIARINPNKGHKPS